MAKSGSKTHTLQRSQSECSFHYQCVERRVQILTASPKLADNEIKTQEDRVNVRTVLQHILKCNKICGKNTATALKQMTVYQSSITIASLAGLASFVRTSVSLI